MMKSEFSIITITVYVMNILISNERPERRWVSKNELKKSRLGTDLI